MKRQVVIGTDEYGNAKIGYTEDVPGRAVPGHGRPMQTFPVGGGAAQMRLESSVKQTFKEAA